MKTKKIKFLLTILFLFLGSFTFWYTTREYKTTYLLNVSIKEGEKKEKILEEKKEELETTKEKLENPDYLEVIARNTYLLTKDGEQIFKF